MPKKLAAVLCLAVMATSACAEESKVGTAWQCARDYIVVTYFGLGGAAQEASIWPNKKGPYGDCRMKHRIQFLRSTTRAKLLGSDTPTD